VQVLAGTNLLLVPAAVAEHEAVKDAQAVSLAVTLRL
jgi:hypothetical protein